MGLLLIFSFLAGIITILSPCILPVLPIVLAGSVGNGKARPFGVVLGFVISFTVFTLSLTALVQLFNFPAEALRWAAMIMIILFGLVLLIPRWHEWFMTAASRLVNTKPGKQVKKATGAAGLIGGLPIGFSLGLVWTPCVGPIMASVVSLALTNRVDGGAVLITIAYTLGTTVPMLAVMLGGRALLQKVPVLMRNTARIQKVFGVLMIITGIAIALGWDRQFQSAVLNIFPGYGSGLTAIENTPIVRDALSKRQKQPQAMMQQKTDTSFRPAFEPSNGVLSDYGTAPDFVTNGRWYLPDAEPPLTMQALRGKVVLIDFWTYSCVNCIRTLPYLKAWDDAYRAMGLVIIGVHTPEFEFEKNGENVKKAIANLGITWPVVLDNDYAQWQAYNNRYWPAHYFIDAQGKVRYYSFGEGQYAIGEKVIQELLQEAGQTVNRKITTEDPEFEPVTSETYLGHTWSQRFASAVEPVVDAFINYSPSRIPANGEWNLNGKWMIANEYVVPESKGQLQLGFVARDVFLVIEPESVGGKILVQVDGKAVADTADVHNSILIPQASRLYHLVALRKSGAHVLQLEIEGKFRLFAFTFG